MAVIAYHTAFGTFCFFTVLAAGPLAEAALIDAFVTSFYDAASTGREFRFATFAENLIAKITRRKTVFTKRDVAVGTIICRSAT